MSNYHVIGGDTVGPGVVTNEFLLKRDDDKFILDLRELQWHLEETARMREELQKYKTAMFQIETLNKLLQDMLNAK